MKRHQGSLHRPVVWVVGASRGIGKEIAKAFASIGCAVCCSGRNQKELREVVREIDKQGGYADLFPCDITKSADINKTFKIIHQKFGKVDVLINNAGITVFKTFLQTSSKEFSDIIKTNLEGQVGCVRAVLPLMVKRQNGWIINILSNAALKTFEASSAYSASKAGMLGFSRVLREEMRQFNVRVVNIIPGATSTAMWSSSDRKKYKHRMMTAKGVAEAVLAVYQMPEDVVTDEILLRPIKGDID
ncbi:MAG TPA: SDR family oxidoreductase [Bacteroidota bacterium]|nr:SDR family oxidoreductase [Bacteroidota bacterium]